MKSPAREVALAARILITADTAFGMLKPLVPNALSTCLLLPTLENVHIVLEGRSRASKHSC